MGEAGPSLWVKGWPMLYRPLIWVKMQAYEGGIWLVERWDQLYSRRNVALIWVLGCWKAWGHPCHRKAVALYSIIGTFGIHGYDSKNHSRQQMFGNRFKACFDQDHKVFSWRGFQRSIIILCVDPANNTAQTIQCSCLREKIRVYYIYI